MTGILRSFLRKRESRGAYWVHAFAGTSGEMALDQSVEFTRSPVLTDTASAA
jgi:hypothetical protein